MPKGPRGEKRPADVIGGAVKVARIATGEIEDERYAAPGRSKSGRAGAKARAESLSMSERQEIARKAAKSRWDKGKERTMSEKDRLLAALFESPNIEHLNIKFCRGLSDNTSPEDLCREANAAIFQVESGLVESSPSFGDKERKVVDVRELLDKN